MLQNHFIYNFSPSVLMLGLLLLVVAAAQVNIKLLQEIPFFLHRNQNAKYDNYTAPNKSSLLQAIIQMQLLSAKILFFFQKLQTTMNMTIVTSKQNLTEQSLSTKIILSSQVYCNMVSY